MLLLENKTTTHKKQESQGGDWVGQRGWPHGISATSQEWLSGRLVNGWVWRIPRIGGEKPGRACQRAHSGRCPRSDANKNRGQWNICMLCLAFFQVSPAFTCGVWQCRMYPWRTCHQDAGFVTLKGSRYCDFERNWHGSVTRIFIVSLLAICQLRINQASFYRGWWTVAGTYFCKGKLGPVNEKLWTKRVSLHKHTWAGKKTDYCFFHLSGTKSNLCKHLIVLYQQSGKSLPAKKSLPECQVRVGDPGQAVAFVMDPATGQDSFQALHIAFIGPWFA